MRPVARAHIYVWCDVHTLHRILFSVLTSVYTLLQRLYSTLRVCVSASYPYRVALAFGRQAG